jgi:hypothetical protein
MTVQPTLAEITGAIKEAQKTAIIDPNLALIFGSQLGKASTFTQSSTATSGLTFYDLEAGAKFLYPVLTPLRNMIPRVSGKGGIQANWRAITGINTSALYAGVSGGNRGAIQAISTQDYIAAYKGIGLETVVDFEAQYAGMNFDDLRAIAGKVGLESLMLQEEAILLGGNTSTALGTTPTPTVANATTGGSIGQTITVSVICVALAFDAFVRATVAGGINASVTRNNNDGSSDTFGGGSAQKSANATTTTPTDGLSTHVVTATVTAVKGAVGYAWFWSTAGNEVLGAITTINSVLITTAAGTGSQLASSIAASDQSTNALVFDGLLYNVFKSGSNAYLATQPTGTAGTGTPLTADGAGGVVEIDVALKSFWDNYRLSPDTMWVNSQEALNISKKIVQGAANAAQRFVFESVQDAIGGGIMVRTYLNRFSMQGANVVDIKIHPNIPAGTILFTTKSLPYPVNGVGNVFQVRARQEYYQIEWPLRSRRYEYGVYADEVLQNYFPPAFGIITNIGNG